MCNPCILAAQHKAGVQGLTIYIGDDVEDEWEDDE